MGGVMSGLDLSQKKKNFSEHGLSSQKPPILSAAMATQDPSPLSGDQRTLAFTRLHLHPAFKNPVWNPTWLVFIPVRVSERQAVVPDVVHTPELVSVGAQADPPEIALS